MKIRMSLNLLLLAVIFWTANLYADWKADWEQTVAGAKKEGRLNLYVGRYGQAALLEEFKKDYPEIKIAAVNGTGDQLATRIAAEVRAGKTIADIYSGGPNSSYSSLYRGKILDSIRAASYFPKCSMSPNGTAASISSPTARTNSSSSTLRCLASAACLTIPTSSTQKNLSLIGI